MFFSFPQVGHCVGICLKSFSTVPVLATGELLSCWWGAGGERAGQNVFPGLLLETLPIYSFLDGIKITTFLF